jgi:hypothetical protein
MQRWPQRPVALAHAVVQRLGARLFLRVFFALACPTPSRSAASLSVDEDPAKLAAFVKSKGYTFPVMVSKAYAEKLLPQIDFMPALDR